MKFIIIAKCENGKNSTEEEVKEALEETMRISKMIGGELVYGKGFSEGCKVIIEKVH